MKRMTEKKQAALDVYNSYLPNTKAKVNALVALGLSRSYAYDLLQRLEIQYLINSFR